MQTNKKKIKKLRNRKRRYQWHDLSENRSICSSQSIHSSLSSLSSKSFYFSHRAYKKTSKPPDTMFEFSKTQQRELKHNCRIVQLSTIKINKNYFRLSLPPLKNICVRILDQFGGLGSLLACQIKTILTQSSKNRSKSYISLLNFWIFVNQLQKFDTNRNILRHFVMDLSSYIKQQEDSQFYDNVESNKRNVQKLKIVRKIFQCMVNAISENQDYQDFITTFWGPRNRNDRYDSIIEGIDRQAQKYEKLIREIYNYARMNP